MMSRDLIPTPIEHFLTERFDDDILLYHPGLTKTIQLNQTASIIWALCDGQRTIGEITTLLAASFPDEDHRILIDVEATLQRFASEGALMLR
jgi:Coenzyme PQQ synthesis protein D (PqqD)